MQATLFFCRPIVLTLVAGMLLLLLGACSGTETEKPVGIGSEANEMKRSPCACIEIQQIYPEGYRDSLRGMAGLS